MVYSKRPFDGPKEVLRYLARYTHRVAISNSRLIAIEGNGVTLKWKDYRIEGRDRFKVMTLATNEFIRRFLIQCYPQASAASLLRPASQHSPGQQHRASARTARLPSPGPMPPATPAPMPATHKNPSIHAPAAAAA